MQEYYHKWYSQHLSRDFEMLVFGYSGLPIILFPPAKGRYYHSKDYGLIDSVKQFINNGKVKIYCPDTIDDQSWFDNIAPSDKIEKQIIYENLIIDEVIGFAKYESEIEKVGIAGCDFGAYQVLNLSLKHPEIISNMFTMGGSFSIKRFINDFYSDDCYYNSPLDYFPHLTDEKYLNNISEINIMLGSGENDLNLHENEVLSKYLHEKDLDHRFDVVPNADHDWPWWRHMFYSFLNDLDY